jgi:hypothetical protein
MRIKHKTYITNLLLRRATIDVVEYVRRDSIKTISDKVLNCVGLKDVTKDEGEKAKLQDITAFEIGFHVVSERDMKQVFRNLHRLRETYPSLFNQTTLLKDIENLLSKDYNTENEII